jgi:nicotinamidase-related amidase
MQFSPEIVKRVTTRQGRLYANESFDPPRTALVVVDMQNYYMKPGFQSEVPAARDTVPAVNRLAGALRAAGGTVVWIQTTSDGADKSWRHHHGNMLTPERSARRLKELATGGEGYQLWSGLDARPEDLRVVKRRYSAMIAGSSNLEAEMRGRGIDTLLIAGTATNVCCESTARDAMMLDFSTVMVADCLSAMSPAEHQQSLEHFILFFGDVMESGEVIERLGR